MSAAAIPEWGRADARALEGGERIGGSGRRSRGAPPRAPAPPTARRPPARPRQRPRSRSRPSSRPVDVATRHRRSARMPGDDRDRHQRNRVMEPGHRQDHERRDRCPAEALQGVIARPGRPGSDDQARRRRRRPGKRSCRSLAATGQERELRAQGRRCGVDERARRRRPGGRRHSPDHGPNPPTMRLSADDHQPHGDGGAEHEPRHRAPLRRADARAGRATRNHSAHRPTRVHLRQAARRRARHPRRTARPARRRTADQRAEQHQAVEQREQCVEVAEERARSRTGRRTARWRAPAAPRRPEAAASAVERAPADRTPRAGQSRREQPATAAIAQGDQHQRGGNAREQRQVLRDGRRVGVEEVHGGRRLPASIDGS